MIYAGFWKRFAAYIIDLMVLVLAFFVLGLVLGAAGVKVDPAVEGLLNLAGIFAFWLYYALQESSERQATLGKWLLGIKVTRMDGSRIGFGQASGRFFGKIVSGLLLTIGYWMAGFTAKKQALHDMMAGCLVVNRDVTPETLKAPGSFEPGSGGGMPGWAIVLVVLGCMVPVIGILAAIAIPQYQQYTVRARSVQSMNAVRPIQLEVTKYATTYHRLPTETELKTQIGDENYAAAACSGVVQSATYADEGTIMVVFNNSGPGQGCDGADVQVPFPLAGKSFVIRASLGEGDDVRWAIESGNSEIPAKYLPRFSASNN